MPARVRAAAAVLAGAALIWAAPAGAATIGYLPPTTPVTNCGASDQDVVQVNNVVGATFVVPPYGATISSWSTYAASPAGQQLTFKVFRKVAQPSKWEAVGHDGPRMLTPSSVNTFGTGIAVKPGDVIGINSASGGLVQNACTVSGLVGSDDFDYHNAPGLADGDNATFTPSSGSVVNASAVVKPSNQFSFGPPFINDFKGQARLAVNVPGPGVLTLSGPQVKDSSATVTAGPVAATLVMKPKKKLFKKLKKKGKAVAAATVTYTPADGDPAEQTTSVKLKKKRKKPQRV